MLPTVQSSDKAHKRVHESNLREDQLCRLLPPTILHNQPWGASQLKWEKNKINNKSLVAWRSLMSGDDFNSYDELHVP